MILLFLVILKLFKVSLEVEFIFKFEIEFMLKFEVEFDIEFKLIELLELELIIEEFLIELLKGEE